MPQRASKNQCSVCGTVYVVDSLADACCYDWKENDGDEN